MTDSMRQVSPERPGGNSLWEAELASVMNELRQLTLVVRRATATRRNTAAPDAATSAAEALLLRQLDERPASSISELARRVHADRSGVSVSVTRLAKRGLVIRESSPSDRRMTAIRLTTNGHEILAASAGRPLTSPHGAGRLAGGDFRELAGKLARLARMLLETTEVTAA
jgi:DNA-binding MarR family transcriptional regulator